jgi:hypothetical protein
MDVLDAVLYDRCGGPKEAKKAESGFLRGYEEHPS